MPSAVNTAPEELVNWPARSLIRNLTEAARCDQPPVPGEQRRRGHGEHPLPSDAGGSAGTAPRATAGRPADLAAQYRVLMPQHQQPGVLGHLTPILCHQAVKQATREQADDRQDHPAMISNLAGCQGESSNRAPQDCQLSCGQGRGRTADLPPFRNLRLPRSGRRSSRVCDIACDIGASPQSTVGSFATSPWTVRLRHSSRSTYLDRLDRRGLFWHPRQPLRLCANPLRPWEDFPPTCRPLSR